MSAFNAIVMATDGSEPSLRAAKVAGAMAATENTPLYVVNVIRDEQFPQALSRMAEVEKLVGTRSDVLQYVADKIVKDAVQTAKKAGAKTIAQDLQHRRPERPDRPLVLPRAIAAAVTQPPQR